MTEMPSALPSIRRRVAIPGQPQTALAAAVLIALTCGAALAAPAPASPTVQEILPFSEIKAGMTGVGRTVFGGTRVDEFQVEVIGTLENVAPRRDLILVRLSGGPLATTGVLAGMSGSPIYLGGRLAGAVAYTWGFAREPIAGVVPIQEMLEIASFDETTVNELRSRARNALLMQAIASEEQAENVDAELLGLEGMDGELAAKLAQSGVKTRDDLADLALDYLLEMASIDPERAKTLIMSARAHWFAEG